MRVRRVGVEAWVRGWRQPAARVVALGALALGVSAAAVLLLLWNLRRDTLAESRAAAVNLAMMTRVQTARVVQAVDLALADLRALAQTVLDDAPDNLAALLQTEAVQTRLLGGAQGLPLAKSFSVIDARGRMLAYAGPGQTSGAGFADRDYFRHFARGGDGLFISAPARSRVDGAWTVFLARRMTDTQGRFAGVVVAALPLTTFKVMLESLALPQDSGFTLVRADGVVLMHAPEVETAVGRPMPVARAWLAAVMAGGGTYDGTGAFDGVRRVVAVQPVPGYPLVVDIALSVDVALRPWRLHAVQILGGAGLILAGCALLLGTLRRLVSRLENSRVSLAFKHAELARASDRLRDSQARLEAQTALLQTTLETMDQGLMMVDAEGRVVVCNHQAVQMLELPEAMMRGAPMLAEVVAYQRARGEFASAGPDVRRMMDEVDALHRPTYERLRPNGMALEIRSVEVPGGGMVRTYTDVTQRRAAEERIRHVASHDPLTGLCNRARFGEALAGALEAAARGHHSLAVLYLDLDHFKQVNDSLGHAAGDMLLEEVARRMRASVRDSDIVARMGGDEFAIIQPNADRPDSTMALARRLLAQVAAPYAVLGGTAVVGVSIGIAWYPEDGLAAEELLRNADSALYAAKRGGRNTVRCHGQAEAVATS